MKKLLKILIQILRIKKHCETCIYLKADINSCDWIGCTIEVDEKDFVKHDYCVEQELKEVQQLIIKFIKR